MKNRKRYFTALCLVPAFVLGACSGHSTQQHAPEQGGAAAPVMKISADSLEAAGAYLTYNHANRPVLCWTEKTGNEQGWMLKYAVFDESLGRFAEPIAVWPSAGTRAHDESMNKVGFKADGTVVALYAIKHPTENNPYAGSIYYTLSADEGKTWSVPAYLHSDTLPVWGRGYFDLATLPNGEVGAVWLDGRFSETEQGSSLFFASTTPGNGFGSDLQIGESTCECCRTDLFTDAGGKIHVAYRDISLPENGAGKQLRDLSYSYSDDGGKSFTKAKALSPDNWQIEGCPHTGPSLAANRQGLHAVWFTAGGEAGTYYSLSATGRNSFGARVLVKEIARHPQLIAMQHQLVLVWDEFTQTPEEKPASVPGHGQHAAHAAAAAGGAGVIVLRQISDGAPAENKVLSALQKGSASHPVLIALNEHQVVVAWTQTVQEKRGVYYTLVDLEDK